MIGEGLARHRETPGQHREQLGRHRSSTGAIRPRQSYGNATVVPCGAPVEPQ
ncbi:hypothetical protein DPMN_031135 [Dreissena polymorpha]|uniref:Uncharacterized protein n=1 Tax=Dreissena polymorpha TaxID=45954 RepID=A0A9D4M268_DREPO|nr:hypothetical protein DPMN_031135 [Dreissena polymorpha]